MQLNRDGAASLEDKMWVLLSSKLQIRYPEPGDTIEKMMTGSQVLHGHWHTFAHSLITFRLSE